MFKKNAGVNRHNRRT